MKSKDVSSLFSAMCPSALIISVFFLSHQLLEVALEVQCNPILPVTSHEVATCCVEGGDPATQAEAGEGGEGAEWVETEHRPTGEQGGSRRSSCRTVDRSLLPSWHLSFCPDCRLVGRTGRWEKHQWVSVAAAGDRDVGEAPPGEGPQGPAGTHAHRNRKSLTFKRKWQTCPSDWLWSRQSLMVWRSSWSRRKWRWWKRGSWKRLRSTENWMMTTTTLVRTSGWE